MLYISTAAIPAKTMDQCIENLLSIGVDHIELSGGTEYDAESLGQRIRYQKDHNVKYLVHYYFPAPKQHFVLNLASQKQAIRKKSLAFIETSLKFSGALGVDRYSVHAGYLQQYSPNRNNDGFVSDGKDRIDKGQGVELMYQSLSQIAEIADEKNVKISLENLFPIKGQPNSSLLCTPLDIFDYLERIKEVPSVGLLLDLAHLFISSTTFSFDRDKFLDELLDRFPEKIFGLHLSHNDGILDSHLPLQKGCWPLANVRRFINAEIPITLESRGMTIEQVQTQIQMIGDVIA